jgi:predicted Zn-dependent peptidase
MHNEKRIGLSLLNNILGGPGMNSRLNVALRERHGLVYQVESHITFYTDTGLCSIYFGTDPKNKDKAFQLVKNELQRLCDQKMSDMQLSMAKKQAFGQMVLSNENKEAQFLGLGKAFLHYNRYDSLQEIFRKIESVSPTHIMEIANEIYNPERLFCLVYE